MTKVFAASADGLFRETLAALDTCLATLTAIEEQAARQLQAADLTQTTIRRYANELGAIRPPVDQPAAEGDDPSRVSLDREAIYRDELVLQQTVTRLHTLRGRLDYLTNLLRAGRSHVLGSDPSALASSPWSAAVRSARIAAQEEERTRLAREIHDGPAQVLVNMIHGLELCRRVALKAPAEISPELTRLQEQANDGLSEVRRFMFDLRPRMLAHQGLNATLQSYVERFQEAFPLTVDLSLPPAELPLDASAQIVIFRIAQESLHNIQKHASASHVTVELSGEADGGCRLRISDNGRGFEPHLVQPTSRSGAGLIGMQERTIMLDGELTIDSAPGQGTVILLQLPPRRPADSLSHDRYDHRSAASQHRSAELAVETGD